MNVDKMSQGGSIFFMEKKNSDLKKLTNNFRRTNHFFNVGSGKDISIKDLAFLMKEILAFDGNIIFNKTMPDGTPKKLLDIELMESLGWTSKIPLRQGILDTYSWYENNYENLRF